MSASGIKGDDFRRRPNSTCAPGSPFSAANTRLSRHENAEKYAVPPCCTAPKEEKTIQRPARVAVSARFRARYLELKMPLIVRHLCESMSVEYTNARQSLRVSRC